MKIVTAIDSFKGCMTSMEAGNAVAKGFRKVDPTIDVSVRPIADGGEGTVEALVEGMGGAGGIGFAFLTFLKARLSSGVQIVLEESGLETYIQNADLVVTGEGRLDGQSAMGKAPVGVASLAKQYGKPVIAFSGSVTPDASICNQKGIDAFFPILRKVTNLSEAMEKENAMENLCASAEQVMRLIYTLR